MPKGNAFMNFLDSIGSAVRVAGAVEGRHQPKARDLRKLGIDPVQFGKIGR